MKQINVRTVFYPEKQASNGTQCQAEGRPKVAIESSIHHAGVHSTWAQWETSSLQLLVKVGT